MSDTAAAPPGGGGFLERYFKFGRHGTTLGRDTMAGVTTFVVMSYIIFVNPQILSFAGIEGLSEIGLPFNQVLAATCLVAGVMTILMGLYTNKAYAIAPGLGLNAVVAFSLVAGEGLSFPAAMGLVVVEGIAVTILVLTGMRERIMDAIPLDLKKAIAIGIGLFIAFIGLVNSGLVVRGDGHGRRPRAADHVADLRDAVRARPHDRAARAGRSRRPSDRDRRDDDPRDDHQRVERQRRRLHGGRDPGPATSTRRPTSRCSATSTSTRSPSSRSSPRSSGRSRSSSPTSSTRWARSSASASRPATWTRTAACEDIRKPLLVDSLAAVAGGAASTSSATTYIESASGVSVGGRTGWVAVVAGALFFPFMFFAPIIGMVPPQATAPALILVGFLMMSALTEAEEDAEGRQDGRKLAGIDFTDLAIGLGAALTIMFMPFTFSITDGIGMGFLAFTVARTAQGRAREIHPFMWIASAMFVLYFAVPILQDTFDWI